MATHLPPFIRRIEKIFGCSYAKYQIIKPVDKALDAFTIQRGHAKARGITWELNLWQWWTIWQESGHWDERGRGGNSYCMSRKGDTGPYSAENVFIATFRKNSSDHPNKKSGLPMGVRTTSTKAFAAYRSQNGREVYLGSYPTPAQAHAVYLRACGDL